LDNTPRACGNVRMSLRLKGDLAVPLGHCYVRATTSFGANNAAVSSHLGHLPLVTPEAKQLARRRPAARRTARDVGQAKLRARFPAAKSLGRRLRGLLLSFLLLSSLCSTRAPVHITCTSIRTALAGVCAQGPCGRMTRASDQRIALARMEGRRCSAARASRGTPPTVVLVRPHEANLLDCLRAQW